MLVYRDQGYKSTIIHEIVETIHLIFSAFLLAFRTMRKNILRKSLPIVFYIVILRYYNNMGVTKTAHYTTGHNALVKLIKALAHPARLAIVEHLIRVNSCICNDIVSEIPLAQATISRHLLELKSAGLIRGRVSGNSICYCLDEKAVKKLENYFQNISQNLAKSNENCC